MLIFVFLLLFQGYSEADYTNEVINTKDLKKLEIVSAEAIKLYPDSYSLNLNIAYKYLSLKNYKKSYFYYQKVYKIYPSLEALLGLSYTQLELKKYEELLNVTSSYIKNNTSRPVNNTENKKYIYLRRAIAFLALEKYDKSISESKLGLNLYPNYQEFNKTIKYAQSMKPKFSLNLIPIWGAISYSEHPNKISYNYYGGATYLSYGVYNMDLSYIQGNIENNTETKTEHNLNLGLGYNKKYNLYLHLSNIFLEDADLISPYLHFGYNFKHFSLVSAFAGSFYESLDNPVYQGTLYGFMPFFDNKLTLSLGAGYKYLKQDKKASEPYTEIGLAIKLHEKISIKSLFRYNQSRYFVDYGGLVDNSSDDIKYMAEIGLSLKFSSFIITPMYRYYSIDLPPMMPPPNGENQGVFIQGNQNGTGEKPSSSKSFFTVMFGYEF